MRQILSIILFLVFALNAKAQQNTFDFQIQRLDDTNYEMQLQLSDANNVQFIQITFLEQGNELEIYEASLNKKSDGKFYLFFQNEEFPVQLDFMPLTFTHDYGELRQPTVVVKLLDFDFNVLAEKEQIIY